MLLAKDKKRPRSEVKMKGPFFVVGAAVIIIPWLAVAQDVGRGPAPPIEGPLAAIPGSRPPSHFRQIYHCEQSNSPSASALGEIPGWKMITVVGRGGKGGALVKESLPDESFGAGVFQGTRLELQPALPCSAAGLAILAPPNRVEAVRLDETNEPSAIARIIDYFDARNKKGFPGEDADERPGVYLTNYHIADAKAFSLTPSFTVVQANITYDAYVLVQEKPARELAQIQMLGWKYEKEDGPNGPTPMLFVVGDEVTELTKEFRGGSSICDELVSAFKISNHIHIHVSANGCNNGINGQMVFDLSGRAPKAVFSNWDLSD